MTERFPELEHCTLCPQACGADRYQGSGFCGAGHRIRINLSQLHHGEEPVLSGSRGSGTIFFSHCNLACVFCQNYAISHQGWGTDYSLGKCAQQMLELQERGAHNINLVSPTHYSIQLIAALKLARRQGLTLPVVWNSNAYESASTLSRLSGLVQIYLPDFKYGHNLYSTKYSGAKDYPRVALQAVKEMWRQVGGLETDASGIAIKGVLLRHLVLPNRLSGSTTVLNMLRDEIGTGLHLSLMAQYYPAGEANRFPELNRGISHDEYQAVVETARTLGFTRIYVQELSCSSDWTPDFLEPVRQPETIHNHINGF